MTRTDTDRARGDAPLLKRLLITGAAGGLARLIRPRLAPMAEILRLSDVIDIDEPAASDEVLPCDLSDAAAVHDMVADCDGIVHLGGISREDSFDRICDANIRGLFNLYEAARAHGHPRIVMASSNHVVGFHPQSRRLTAADPTRPDSLYGVSKVYGEALASMYYDKFGQQTAIVRIGSCFSRPKDRRMLSSWLSPDDLTSLIGCAFRAPHLGCPVIWGASDNAATWWDNAAVSYLGWRPQSDAETYREDVEATTPMPAPDDPQALFQGGGFTAEPIHRD